MSNSTPLKRSSSSGGDDESPPEKIRPDSHGLIRTAVTDIQESQLAVNEKTDEISYDAMYELLGNFKELVEDMPINIGTFEVISCNYVPFGEVSTLTEPVTNIVLMDSQKQKSVFTAFGDHAKLWSGLEIGQIVQLENFGWRKDFKDKSRFYGFSSKHCGQLIEQSTFIVNPDLTKIFAEYRHHQVDHVTSFSEIKKDYERLVLYLDFKQKKGKIRCKDGILRDRLDCFFLTSDRIHIVLTAFAKNCDLLASLNEKKVFVIENLIFYEDVAHHSEHLQFTVTAATKFTPTDLELKPMKAHKINLMQISAGDFDKSALYEIEGYVRQNSAKCSGKDFSQSVLFDDSSTTDITFAAVFRFTDAIALVHGQKITFKCHVEEAHEKKILSVMTDSIVVMKETCSADRIASTKFSIV